MKILLTLAVTMLSLVLSASAHAAIKTEVIDYQTGDTKLKGYLAYDDSVTDKRPGVIVMPEWWGLTDYPKHRAEQLAGLGYVAFAADMFGEGKTTDDPKQAGAWAGAVKKDPQVVRARAMAALDELKKQPNVDADKIGAIGYCFGGSIVLAMARENMPLKGVVTFHGDLSTDHPATGKIQPQILVLTGAADAFVPPEQVKKFKDEMSKAGAGFKVIEYPDAQHAFTNPDADRHKIPNIKYNEQADRQSWDEMKKFFSEIFK